MPTDPYWAAIIAECQRGVVWEGGRTGGFCRKRDLCRLDRMCHFVAQAERHAERVQYAELRSKVAHA